LLPFALPPSAQQSNPQKRVLILSEFGHSTPAYRALENSLRAVVMGSLPPGVRIYSEYLDTPSVDESGSFPAFRDYLRSRHATPPDVILSFGKYSFLFMLENAATLFPGVPVVFAVDHGAHAARQPLPGNFTGVSDSSDYAAPLELALRLQPETERVFVVMGASSWDQSYGRAAREDLARLEQRLQLTYLSGLPIEQLERRLATLPPRSIVFHVVLTSDSAGGSIVPNDGLDRLTQAANAPVYGWLVTAVGHGVVGVRSFDLDALTDSASRLVAQVLSGTPPADLSVERFPPDLTILDWTMVRHWRIDPKRIPPGSTIVNRVVTPWRQYRREIVIALSVMALEALLIVALMVQRERRRRAEQLAQRKEQALRSSYGQIQVLARRLITAQEAERARIARELHDDVNQQLAALSIRLSELEHELPDHAFESRRKVEWLRQHAVELVETVRDMSHDLHPGVLRHAGLVPALRSATSAISGQHGLAVHFHVQDESLQLPDDVALTLYRITQEALHNVVRHADALRATVRLTQTDQNVHLEIVDDGRGFAITDVESAGLGLMSIQERLSLIDGELQIDSQAGGGTRLLVRIPLKARVPQPAGQ
jgi:signal transduction histidine kinase